MPDELDEFPMRPEDGQDDEARRGRGAPPAGSKVRLGPLWVALVAVAAFVAVGVLVFRYQPSRPARPSPPPTSPAETPQSATAVRPPLPPLDASDDAARRIAAALSVHPDFVRWLAQSGLVRTATVVVSNVADGETPRPHLGFLAPRQRFRALRGSGRRIVPDPAGFAGYDSFADAIATIDAPAAAEAYRSLEPLFDAAYRDLGHPEGFRGALERAIAALLAVPLPPSDAELVPHAIGFRWADPRLEGLTAAQKQFLRIGPRNQQLVQAKLRELQAALAAAPSEAPVESSERAPGPSAPAAPGPAATL